MKKIFLFISNYNNYPFLLLMDINSEIKNFYKSYKIKSTKDNYFDIEIYTNNDGGNDELTIYTSKFEDKIKTEYIKNFTYDELKEISYFQDFNNLIKIAQKIDKFIDKSSKKGNPSYLEEFTDKFYLHIPSKNLIFEIDEKEKTCIEMIQDLNIKINDSIKEKDQNYEGISNLINTIEDRINKKNKEIIDIKNLYDSKIEEINKLSNKKFEEQNNKINLLNKENENIIQFNSNLESTINEIKNFFELKFNTYQSKIDLIFNEFNDFKKSQNENNENIKDLIDKNLEDYKNKIQIYNDKNFDKFEKYELNQKENNASIEKLKKNLNEISNKQNETNEIIDDIKIDNTKINNDLKTLNEKIIEISEKENKLAKNIESLKNQNKNEINNSLKPLETKIKNITDKQEELNKNINNLKNTVSNLKDHKEKNSNNNDLNKKIDFGKIYLKTDFNDNKNNYNTNNNDNNDFGKYYLNTDNNDQNDNYKLKTLNSSRNLKPSLSNSNFNFRNSASQRNIFNKEHLKNNTISSTKDIFFNLDPAKLVKKNPQMEKLIKTICENKNMPVKISQKVCDIMMAVDRNDFVPIYSQNQYNSKPYDDGPQLINKKMNVRISAPHMHFYALTYLEDYLKSGCHILDIGSGTGYL